MQSRNWIIGALVLIIVLVGAYFYFSPGTAAPTTPNRSLVSTAVYTCDQGKTIAAAYYEGPAAPQPAPGEPATPTGSVDVSIGGAATTTLAQTISADGTRYANADESLVFWSKGNSALVMRNNTMDLDYSNCLATATPAS